MLRNLAYDQLEERIKVLNEHLDAENRHDIEAIMITYEDRPEVTINGHVFTGLENIRFSRLRVDERNRYIHHEAIIIEQTLRGPGTVR